MTPPRLRPGLVIAGIAAVAGGTFALWPVRPRTITAPAIKNAKPAKRTLAALDQAAFRVPIWVAEPPPPPPPAAIPPPPPPPPLKLQLLAIIREGNTYKAAIYDPDTDRILVAAAGERLGIRTIEQVNKSSLTLRDETGTRVLALKEGGTP